MVTLILRRLSLAIVLLAGPLSGWTEELILHPVDQVDATEGAPNQNFAAQKYSRVGYSLAGAESPDDEESSRVWVTYLKFRLPAPANAGPITAATLTVDAFFLDGKQRSIGINLKYASNDEWTVDSLTSRTAPEVSSSLEVFKADVSTADPAKLDFDVVEFLTQSGEGFGSDLSIVIMGRGNTGGYLDPEAGWMRIGKADGQGEAPTLTISYTPQKNITK